MLLSMKTLGVIGSVGDLTHTPSNSTH